MSKPFDFFPYRDGELTADGVSLREIADRHGTPTYVYSAEALLSPLRELQSGLQGLDPLICFAVKSNSNIGVLKLLAEEGAGMDLVSGGELFRASKAGVRSDRMVFSGVGKTREEMLQAIHFDQGRGIYSFNVESEPELALLSGVARGEGKKARVALRFNPDVDPRTHPYISTGLKKNKFGIRRSEILEIVRNRANYPGVSIEGLSVHIGSQLLSLKPLEEAFGHVRALISEIHHITGDALRFVDLGGGIGITYRREKSPSIAKYCALIQKFFGRGSEVYPPLRVLVEPGRSIAGNAGLLLSRMLYRKSRAQKDFVILDAAMNDLMRPSLYGSYHEIVPARKSRARMKRSDIVGPVCESGDCFASNRPFPGDVRSGELVAILSAGAYGFTMAGNYNSRPRPAEVLVQDGHVRTLRHRETYADLIRHEELD